MMAADIGMRVLQNKKARNTIIGVCLGIFMLPAILLTAANPYIDTPHNDPYQTAIAELAVEKAVSKSLIAAGTLKAIDLIVYGRLDNRTVADIKADIEQYYLQVEEQEVEVCEEIAQADGQFETICRQEKIKVFVYKSDDDIFTSLQRERKITDRQIEDIKGLIKLAKDAGFVDIALGGAPVPTTGGYILPTPHGSVSCGYGCYGGHIGTDVAATAGTIIFAIQDGVIIETENSCLEGDTSCGGGYGNNVKMRHNIDGKAVVTIYAHMLTGSVVVGVGDQVTQGAHIGNVGSTGISTGAHVHVEILENIDYFPNNKTERIRYAINTEQVMDYPATW